MKDDFVTQFRKQQIAWAMTAGIGEDLREGDHGRPWVLQQQHRHRNLFRSEWWRLIAGKEHRWARALTSSQCFAVNLFAPLVESRELAYRTYRALYPDHPLEATDRVDVMLEFTPDGAREWLGERGQPTQVDACFVVSRANQPIGYSLVEVKLTEQEFGSCRGAKVDQSPRGNPSPERCRDIEKVLLEPRKQCWLAESEGRNYWDLLLSHPDYFDQRALKEFPVCPFSGGFYQLMRNSVLALCLVQRGGALWADAGVCIHPSNQGVRGWNDGDGKAVDIVVEFNRFAQGQPIRQIDPSGLVERISACAPELNGWYLWMKARYFRTTG